MLLFSTVGWSTDFEKGLEVYEEKDYKTALREFKPLAEQGHARVIGGFKTDVGYTLGSWVGKQRSQYKHDKLAPDRIEKLEGLRNSKGEKVWLWVVPRARGKANSVRNSF
tara:strand:+ start:156 stop:485 length:330 start_codon:yes stop_codon:yes gene_type:complete